MVDNYTLLKNMNEAINLQKHEGQKDLAHEAFLADEIIKTDKVDNIKGGDEAMMDILKIVREEIGGNKIVEDIIANNPFVAEMLLKTREKDEFTFRHAIGVTDNVITLLESNNKQLDSDLSRETILASLVHDVGKNDNEINVLVRKKRKLTQEECDVVKGHSEKGFHLIRDLKHLSAAKILVRHHELGQDEVGMAKAYPRSGVDLGYDGPERRHFEPHIEEVARILAISDVFDALISERPYKKAMTIDQCEEVLINKFREESDQRNISILVDGFKNQNT